MILKAYNYRIYPTNIQLEYLNNVFGSVRFVWNQLVSNFNSYDKTGPNREMNEKLLKEKYVFLNESISYALQQKRIDFVETKKQYFSKKRKIKLGKMKFKSKGICNDSFRIPGQALNYNECIDFDENTIKLPKMKTIKIVIDRTFTGKLKSVTVSRNKANQYFVSVLVEDEVEQKPRTGRSVGIDLGLTDLMILSDGTKISNPKWFRESQSKLKVSQQHLSRKTKGSNRRYKQRLKVARIHNKISNQRKWFIHNITSWLTSNYDTICAESLKVSNMVKNHKLSKSISDASWSEITRQLEYKSNWYGKTFHKIDRFYPSSKTCSCCDYKLPSLDLDIREWICPSCKVHHDRDLNAAINVLHKGLIDLYQFTSAELTDYRRREIISPSGNDFHPVLAVSMKRLVSL